MKKSLDTILHDMKVVAPAQLQEGVDIQKREGGCLASILLRLGHADERTLCVALSRKEGMPYLVASRSAIPLSALAVVPGEMARKLSVIPLLWQDQTLQLAMRDPHDTRTLDELKYCTGLQVVEYGIMASMLDAVVEQAYWLQAEGKEAFWRGDQLDSSLTLSEAGHLELVTGLSETAAAPRDAEEILDLVDLAEVEISPVAQAPSRGSPLVLVVDDDESIRTMIVKYLTNQGYSVQEAADGTLAMASLQRQLPDLLVLDAMLPGVHGFDICRQIKQTQATSHVPVIMVSAIYRGWGYATDIVKKYGADAFLEKPFSLRDLGERIKQALSQRKVQTTDWELSGKAETSVLAAARAAQGGDLRTAVVHLQQAVDAAPFFHLLRSKLALLYDKLGETNRALAEMERATQLKPSARTLLQFAQLLAKAGFTYKAVEACERALRVATDPTEADAIRSQLNRLNIMSGL